MLGQKKKLFRRKQPKTTTARAPKTKFPLCVNYNRTENFLQLLSLTWHGNNEPPALALLFFFCQVFLF
jgi:hypothetical protein